MDNRRASDFGLMKIDSSGRIINFSEKPKGDALTAMQVDTTVLGLTAEEAKQFPYIASMGIYIFKRDVMSQLLRQSQNKPISGRKLFHPRLTTLISRRFYLMDIGRILERSSHSMKRTWL